MTFRNIRRRAIANGYRSGLEEDIGTQLKKAGVEAEYEPFRIPFTVPVHNRHYTPDYVLPNGVVIESKGQFTSDDRKKHIYIRDQYGADLDLRFVFNNPKGKLRKGSKTSYADWCEKNGFMFAAKEIPDAWLKEKPRKRSLNLLCKLRETK
jgi:hypothetical protein|tara:strand:+ start:4112 stop:4564 length:453 start_codon:yes stop_codon:yes gene_type:complete